MINKADGPGGGQALHFVWLKLAIPPNVGNSGVQFLIVGDCVRAIPWKCYNCKKYFIEELISYIAKPYLTLR